VCVHVCGEGVQGGGGGGGPVRPGIVHCVDKSSYSGRNCQSSFSLDIIMHHKFNVTI